MTQDEILNPILHRKLKQKQYWGTFIVKYQGGKVVHSEMQNPLKDKELDELMNS